MFCVKYKPDVQEFSKFVKLFREITGLCLGGTRSSNSTDKTISTVLSVGPEDDILKLPQRIALSNFALESPITSNGIILRCKDEYLLIERTDSVGYINLIRGSYRPSQLFLMIQEITEDERARLLTHSFDDLWHDLHCRSSEELRKEEHTSPQFEYGKSIFKRIRSYLPKLFSFIACQTRTRWLFPKGRVEWHDEVSESPYDCAVREFKEETNGICLNSESHLISPTPIIEKYLGTNSKNYQTNYFVFSMSTKQEPTQFPKISTPIRSVSVGESSQIKWVHVDELSKYLNEARLALVRHVEELKDDECEVDPTWLSPTGTTDI